MPEDVKVPETPVKTAEVPAEESLIVNPRAAIENAIILENETPDAQPIDDAQPAEVKKDEVKPGELSEVDKIKLAVQKRINQVVAQKKTAEEELAEARAEIARLKAAPTLEKSADKNDAPVTIEQVEAYMVKMREEGNVKEEIAANRYLIKLEKEAAIREIEERQRAIKAEAEARTIRENTALLDLAKDYLVYDDKGQVDMKSDMTLANQKGKLFQTAMALYNDKDLHKEYYNDPDRAMGLRRAVQDAKRELHEQGLINTPKVDGTETVRRNRQVLADPDATELEESPTQSSSNLLSDAERVREEIKSRNKMRIPRRVS